MQVMLHCLEPLVAADLPVRGLVSRSKEFGHEAYCAPDGDGTRKKIAYSTGTTIIVSTVANSRPKMIVTAIETKNSDA